MQAAVINQYNVLMIDIVTDFNQCESQMIKFLLPPTLLSLRLHVTFQKKKKKKKNIYIYIYIYIFFFLPQTQYKNVLKSL